MLLVCGGMAVQAEVNGWMLDHRVHRHLEDEPSTFEERAACARMGDNPTN